MPIRAPTASIWECSASRSYHILGGGRGTHDTKPPNTKQEQRQKISDCNQLAGKQELALACTCFQPSIVCGIGLCVRIKILFVSKQQAGPGGIKLLRSLNCLLVWMITVVYLNAHTVQIFAKACHLPAVANEWLGHLNDHSKVLQEKISLKI